MPPNPPPPASSLSLPDIYHVLFRHKWMIGGFAVAGVLLATCVYLLLPVKYRSDAEVLVRYVVESRNFEPTLGKDTSIKSPDLRGMGILNTEIQIMTSLDLAKQVAVKVGPEKILGKSRQTNALAAAGNIIGGLKAVAVNMSDVIGVSFEHKDPEVARQVLQELVQAYRQKHMEIHQGSGTFLATERMASHDELVAADNRLNQLKATNNIISVEEAKKSLAEEATHLRQDLFVAQAELAEKQAMAKALQAPSAAHGSTNASSATNSAPAAPALPPDRVNTYKDICVRLMNLDTNRVALLSKYTEENRAVQSVISQIAELRKQKDAMETETPGLVLNRPTAASESPSMYSPQADRAQVVGLEAKVALLNQQLQEVNKKAQALADQETTFAELQRERDIAEAKYRYYSSSAEQAVVDDTLQPGRVSNINIIQDATPAYPDMKKRNKTAIGILVGGLLGGIALAFAFELFLDQTIKRPAEVEKKLRLPLLLWMPYTNGHINGSSLSRALPLPRRFWRRHREKSSTRSRASHSDRAPEDAQNEPHRLHPVEERAGERRNPVLVSEDQAPSRPSRSSVNPENESLSPPSVDLETSDPSSIANRKSQIKNAEIAPWDLQHPLRVYYEALRDRLINYFEVKNMTHKPKLVAVSACRVGAGVTSIASGLAGLFSEIGDGNVLLVDMNLEQGAAHPFHNGKPSCTLAEALEGGTRDGAFVHEKLFVASAEDKQSKLPRVLPKRFGSLVPRMKASDYDYIIFDMPPVSQTSITAPLAGHMDVTLLVIEAEKDHLDAVKTAAGMLERCRATVSTVLNKKRTYVPAALSPEG